MTFGYLQVFLILLETNLTLKEKDYVLMFTLHIMAQVIEKTQTDAYIDFVAKYPDIKIGQRTFDKLKPFFVRPVSEKIGTHVFVDTTLSQIFSSNRV